MVHLAKSFFGVLEILNNYGTPWKINTLDSHPTMWRKSGDIAQEWGAGIRQCGAGTGKLDEHGALESTNAALEPLREGAVIPQCGPGAAMLHKNAALECLQLLDLSSRQYEESKV